MSFLCKYHWKTVTAYNLACVSRISHRSIPLVCQCATIENKQNTSSTSVYPVQGHVNDAHIPIMFSNVWCFKPLHIRTRQSVSHKKYRDASVKKIRSIVQPNRRWHWFGDRGTRIHIHDLLNQWQLSYRVRRIETKLWSKKYFESLDADEML